MRRPTLKMFEGCALNQLEMMAMERYFPLSIAGIMKAKLEFGNDERSRKKWINENIRGDKDREEFIDKTGANMLTCIGGDVITEWMPYVLESSDTLYLNYNRHIK